MTIGPTDGLPAAVARASIARRTTEEVVFIPDAGRVVPPEARNDDYIRVDPWTLCFADMAEACRFVPPGSRAAAVWDTDLETDDDEEDPPLRPQDSVLVFGHRRHDAPPVSDSEIARLPSDWNEVNPLSGTPAKIMRFALPLQPPWLAGDCHPQALAWRCELEKAIATGFLPRRTFDEAVRAGLLHEDFLSVSDAYSPADGGTVRRALPGKGITGEARSSRRPQEPSFGDVRKRIRAGTRKANRPGVAAVEVRGPVGQDAVACALAAAEEAGVPLAVVFSDAFPKPAEPDEAAMRKWFNRTDFFRAASADGRIICVGVRNIPAVRAFSLALGLEYITGRRDREGDLGDDATMARALRECRVSAADWTVRDGDGKPLGPAGPFKEARWNS